MSELSELFERLWADYAQLNPHAQTVHDLLAERGERIENDHVALRTFRHEKTGLDTLAAPFTARGYEPRGAYTFPEKHLFARHYEHPEGGPRVFVSELDLDALSHEHREIVERFLDQLPAERMRSFDAPILGRPWSVTWSEYACLRRQSEYAAWLSAFGFRANHFTVSVNALQTFDDLAQLNAFLKQNGIRLNASGGEIKGSPEQGLEQSSTLAGEVTVEFADGRHTIPGCYYEFALRHRRSDGSLFSGFIASSADKIFESTDSRG